MPSIIQSSYDPTSIPPPTEKKGRIAHVLARYIYNPWLFVEEQFNAKNEKWQSKAWELLLDRNFISIRSGNGQGKTCWEAWAALWFLTTRPKSVVVCTATTSKQLQSTLWAELARWIDTSELLKSILQWTSEQVKVRGYEAFWFIQARTAVNSRGEVTEALQGFHADNILYIIDEASGVPDKAIDALESATTTQGAFGIMCSNPTRRSGTFFQSFHKNSKQWGNLHVRPEDGSRMTGRFRERMIQKYGGEDTNGYRIRVRGEFPTTESTALVSFEEYNDPHVQYRPPRDLDPRFALPGKVILLSIDPAGSSAEADATTIGLRYDNDIISIRSFHTLKMQEIAAEVIKTSEEHHPDYIFIDSIGIGAGLSDFLEDYYNEIRSTGKRKSEKNKKRSEVIPVVVKVNVGTAARTQSIREERDNSEDPRPIFKEHFNLRSQLYWTAAQAIKEKVVRIWQDLPLLEEDLTELHTSYTLSHQFKVQSKDEFRDRFERSTDFGDSFALLFTYEVMGGEISPSPDPLYPSLWGVACATHCSELLKPQVIVDLGEESSLRNFDGSDFDYGNF